MKKEVKDKRERDKVERREGGERETGCQTESCNYMYIMMLFTERESKREKEKECKYS